MSFAETLAASRRLFILRALVEANGELNVGVVAEMAHYAGVGQPARAEIEADFDLLAKAGCLTQRWEGPIRVARITDRGEDAAYGRLQVEGVQRTRWDR